MIRILALVLALLYVVALTPGARADTNADVVKVLSQQDLYVSPAVKAAHHVSSADLTRLQQAMDNADKHSAPIKVALVRQYPSQLHDPLDAANHLRNYVDFSGVLVLVSPKGIGVSSDYFPSSTSLSIAGKVQSLCAASYASCAIAAIRAAVPKVKEEQSHANRNVAVFWVVMVVVFGVLVGVLVLFARRKQDEIARNATGSSSLQPRGDAAKG